MFKNLVIRRCEPEDESAYIQLNMDFMQEVMSSNPYWASLRMPTEEEMKSVFKEAMNTPDEILIFVCEADGEVVGYTNTWTVYSIWSRGKSLIVDDLYIALDYRRSGIGKKMMEYLIEFAKNNGYRRVQLHAELDNEKAHGLYRKLGFSEEGILFFMKKLD